MTRSRKRKLQRQRAKWVRAPLATALIVGGVSVHADSAVETGQLEEVVVTAQKRVEDLQKVPISMQVLGSEKLEQLQITSFDDYAKFLPSVSFQSNGPGQAQLFFRGISSGGDGLHSGSSSATGLYLDETPVTTIGNSLDLHVYDVQRVEALAGPQGTLYGASSLSGTLRIITNKPDPAKFSAGYDLEANKYGKGDPGGGFEGFVNIPLNDNAAVRLVGYFEHEGGFITNKYGTHTYQRAVTGYGPAIPDIPADPITANNAGFAKKNFNDIDTFGGRAALKVDLNDQWSVTPSLVYQHQQANGVFNYDPAVGDLQVTDYTKDLNVDQWYQAALTVEGKISDWSVLYNGGYFGRQISHQYDYSEYSIAYDLYAAPVAHLVDNNGVTIDPTQNVRGHDRYTKLTHEIRISSPADNRFRVTAGLFYQRQSDELRYEYRYDNHGDPLASTNLIVNPATNLTGIYSVDGAPGVLYLAQEVRTDHDYAAFADATFDITDKLKLSAGIRGFDSDTTLVGFYGFGEYQGALAQGGEGTCLTPVVYNSNVPCTNTDKYASSSGETHRANLTYQIDPDAMVYGTFSTGFRSGGINRVPYLLDASGVQATVPDYKPDTLYNYELGWKTAWFDRRVRFNGAVFYEKWKGLQIGVSGPNGITSIFNAGNADSRGIEGDLSWNVLDNLNLSMAGTYANAKLTTDFCKFNVVNGYSYTPLNCSSTDPANLLAPAGTRLPVTAEVKGNLTARYKFEVSGHQSFVQGSALHRSSSSTSLVVSQNQQEGDEPGFTTYDFSAGTGFGNMNVELFIENAFDTRGALGKNLQCVIGAPCYTLARTYPAKPQFFGVKFAQKF